MTTKSMKEGMHLLSPTSIHPVMMIIDKIVIIALERKVQSLTKLSQKLIPPLPKEGEDMR